MYFFLDQVHALFIYNKYLNQTPTTLMNKNNNHLTKIALPTKYAKNTLKDALNSIPKPFLIKVKYIYLFWISILNIKVFLFRSNLSKLKKFLE